MIHKNKSIISPLLGLDLAPSLKLFKGLLGDHRVNSLAPLLINEYSVVNYSLTKLGLF